jgi:hypothetical protein
MLNADGQPLAAVIRRFQPPWEEAEAAGAAARRGGTYQQLAAARRRGGGSAAAGQAGEPVPTSTPWVCAEAPRAPESAAAAAAAGLQRLALGPASCPPTAAPGWGGRPPVIVWFRRDLRLADHPALHAAAASGRPVLPVFIWAVSAAGRPSAQQTARLSLRCSRCCLSQPCAAGPAGATHSRLPPPPSPPGSPKSTAGGPPAAPRATGCITAWPAWMGS